MQGLAGNVQGSQGTQGSQGLQGIQGLAGNVQGSQGSQGLQGKQGTQGTQGLAGNVQGAQGSQGLSGSFVGQGAQGSQGISGLFAGQGAQGTQGVSGSFVGQGAQGTQGLSGSFVGQGAQGTQGLSGSFVGQGAQGSQGVQGLSGSFVGQGAQGTQGLSGLFAGQGAQATQGSQGVQGFSGSSGITNITVTETGYCIPTLPITTSGATINISASSNAYGRKFVSTTDPTSSGTICDGDIWFDTSGSSGSTPLASVGSANQVIYKNASNVATGSGNLTFDGLNLVVGGNITAFFSDERLKENIKPISSALLKILSLRGVTYNTNKVAEKYGYKDKKEQVGVIAQDVEKVLPQVVVMAPFDIEYDQNGNKYSKSGENYKTVQYDKIVPLLIEAIKEQQETIINLQNRIQNLENN